MGLVEPTKGAFNFHLPILIPYEALIAISKKKSLDHQTITFIPTKVSGVVTVSHPSISKTNLDEKHIIINTILSGKVKAQLTL